MLCPLIILCHHIFYTLQYFYSNQILQFQSSLNVFFEVHSLSVQQQHRWTINVSQTSWPIGCRLLQSMTPPPPTGKDKETPPAPPFFRMPRHAGSLVLNSFYRCAGCSLCSYIPPCSAAQTQLLKREVKAAEKPAHHRGQEKGCQEHERHHPPCTLAHCPFALVKVVEPPVLTQARGTAFFQLLQNFEIYWCFLVLLTSAVWVIAGKQEISNHWICY